ncbi:uncharacterized protein N7506_000867 [Penicillium brevicompactum]|uniref:uncharacterized protein n=1 Tax=Penicillium brevicompactum TaxID=5074 RepID=UPI0025421F33|nr:uncharacterized protein N7506_000867 [Penicillium brevicompactum]KAJ5347614.1 hypothetical protein N7506_000867 [Penicillium brevicompactum]
MIWKNIFILGLLPVAIADPDPDPKKHKGGGHKGGDEHHETALTTTPIESSSISAPPLRNHSTSEPHTPFTGTATTTGALTATSIGTGIPSEGVAAGATSYPADGKLHHAEPAPFDPAGGVGTNGSTPVYNTKSDFDFESLALALYQEWLEYDLFQDGLRRFNESEFQAAGLSSADRELIQFMAQQELGHVTMLSNILGEHAPQQCTYIYPYTNVKEFIDFCQKLTRFGEAGVYGFLAHLDSREAATLLTQSITTEARQQLIFRQFEGLFPMVEWFQLGIPQSWAWTLLAPFISTCPENQTRLIWQNFPTLLVVDQPNPWNTGITANSPSGQNQSSGSSTATSSSQSSDSSTTTSSSQASDSSESSEPTQTPAPSQLSGLNQTAGFIFNQSSGANDTVGPGVSIPRTPKGSNSTNSTSNCGVTVSKIRPLPLTFPGRRVLLQWDAPGRQVGPNNSYITTTQTEAGSARYVIWVSQLNVTYTTLTIDNSTNGTAITNSTGGRGHTIQPDLETYQGDPAINGTIFIAITDSDPALSPFNLSLINPHVVAGPALYQAGGTRFVTVDASGELVDTHGDIDEHLSNTSKSPPSKAAPVPKATGHQSDSEVVVDQPLPPFLDTILLSIPLTTLHLTLSFLAAHQYAETTDLPELFKNSLLTAFPLLTLFVHLAHGHIIPFGKPRSKNEPSEPSLFPLTADKRNIAFLRKLVFPPALRTYVFLPVAAVLGAHLIAITNGEPYYAVMKKAPAVGTIWIWCILELSFGAAALGALGPLIWGVWWMDYGIF